MKRNLLIILIVVFILSTICGCSEIKIYSVDTELSKLEEKGLFNSVNISATDKNIIVTAEKVMSDSIRTIIILKLKNLKMNPGTGVSLRLTDDKSITYNLTSYTTKQSEIVLEFTGGPKEDSTLTLEIRQFESISGNWLLKIPVKVIDAKEYYVNKQYKIDDTTLIIENIKFSTATTEIRYRESNNYRNIYDSKLLADKKEITMFSAGASQRDDSYIGYMYFDPIDIKNIDAIKLRVKLNPADEKFFDLDIPIN